MKCINAIQIKTFLKTGIPNPLDRRVHDKVWDDNSDEESDEIQGGDLATLLGC